MSFLIYKTVCDLFRLSKESTDSDREKYIKVFSGLRINIQPAGLEYVATMPDGAIGKLFKCFTTYSGCQIGNLIVSSGTITTSGMRYEITGLEEFNGPLGRHYELIVRKSTG